MRIRRILLRLEFKSEIKSKITKIKLNKLLIGFYPLEKTVLSIKNVIIKYSNKSNLTEQIVSHSVMLLQLKVLKALLSQQIIKIIINHYQTVPTEKPPF